MKQAARHTVGLFCGAMLLCTALFAAGTTPAAADETPGNAPAIWAVRPFTTGSDDTGATANAPAFDAPLPSGTYAIQSALPGKAMLEVVGGSLRSGGNVQLYQSNKTKAQQWKLTVGDNGLYTIVNAKSGLALDLSSGKARNGQNLWQYTPNDTPAQMWRIEKIGTAYVIHSAKDDAFVVDAAAGKSRNGTNVQAYKENGTPAQRWWFTPTSPQITSEQTVANGVYEIALASHPSWVVDLSGQSYNNGAVVQLWSRNATVAQRWAFTWERDGYYSIRNVSSGKPLDVAAGNPAARTKVQQYASNGTPAQRWAVQDNGDGTYTLVSKLTGQALDIAGAKAANGTAIQTYPCVKGSSQKLLLQAADVLPEGTYNLFSLLAPTKQVLDVTGGSKKAGTQEQLYSSNGTLAQTFQIRRSTANTYAIQNVYSGMYLEDEAGKVVQRKRQTALAAQQWVASFEGSGVVFANATTGKRLAASGGKSSNGTKAITAGPSNINAQHWRLKGTALLPAHGRFVIGNAGGKALDVTGGSLANGANMQIFAAAGVGAQKFDIDAVGNGAYKIVNCQSKKAVQTKGASVNGRVNVDQGEYKGAASQRWTPSLREDGLLAFTNNASGKVLDVADGGMRNKANVQVAPESGAASQGWMLTYTTYTPPVPKKAVYLTFDDGPGPYTDRLLGILDKYDANATFFVCNGGSYNHLIGRAYKKGHAIAVHSYTHDYGTIYSSAAAYWRDFDRMQAIIVKQTGKKTNLFRFPGGSSNTVSRFNPGIMTRLAKDAKKKGYYYFDWDAGGIDAGGTTSSADVMYDAINGIRSTPNAVVLMHDTKGYSVNAVEGILRWGKANGYTFIALNESSRGAHHAIVN